MCVVESLTENRWPFLIFSVCTVHHWRSLAVPVCFTYVILITVSVYRNGLTFVYLVQYNLNPSSLYFYKVYFMLIQLFLLQCTLYTRSRSLVLLSTRPAVQTVLHLQTRVIALPGILYFSIFIHSCDSQVSDLQILVMKWTVLLHDLTLSI